MTKMKSLFEIILEKSPSIYYGSQIMAEMLNGTRDWMEGEHLRNCLREAEQIQKEEGGDYLEILKFRFGIEISNRY